MKMHNTIRKNDPFLGAQLKAVRTEAGLSQEDLSQEVGIHQSTLSRIENGQKPRQKAFDAIVSFLDRREQEQPDEMEAVLEMVRSSPELRALVKRIQMVK